MHILSKFLLIFFVGKITSVEDIPGIKAKICDIAASKKKILLEREAEKTRKRAEVIDEVLETITDFFLYPRLGLPMEYGYICASVCYREVIVRKMTGKQPPLNDLFNLNDIVQILDMLAENKFLTKMQIAFFQTTGKKMSGRGPYYKLNYKETTSISTCRQTTTDLSVFP